MDELELNAQRNLVQANKSLNLKWQELEDREANTKISLIVAIIFYLILVSVLAFLTYRSFARPISRLEKEKFMKIHAPPCVVGTDIRTIFRSATEKKVTEKK